MTAPPDQATVADVVATRAGRLQTRALNNEASAVAALARLRRGIGSTPGEQVELLEYTHAEDFARGDAPSREEWAIHTALTLFALHQQSQPVRMHAQGRGLGEALRALDSGNDLPPALVRRFTALGTSDSFAELTHHLRGAVQLLRQGGRPLDYGRLATQLLSWQFPAGPARVRLQWGREFYRTRNVTGDTPPDTTPETTTEGSDQ